MLFTPPTTIFANFDLMEANFLKIIIKAFYKFILCKSLKIGFDTIPSDMNSEYLLPVHLFDEEKYFKSLLLYPSSIIMYRNCDNDLN